jgi:hypothetical protein
MFVRPAAVGEKRSRDWDLEDMEDMEDMDWGWNHWFTGSSMRLSIWLMESHTWPYWTGTGGEYRSKYVREPEKKKPRKMLCGKLNEEWEFYDVDSGDDDEAQFYDFDDYENFADWAKGEFGEKYCSNVVSYGFMSSSPLCWCCMGKEIQENRRFRSHLRHRGREATGDYPELGDITRGLHNGSKALFFGRDEDGHYTYL